jgi:hypothetical protein
MKFSRWCEDINIGVGNLYSTDIENEADNAGEVVGEAIRGVI